MYLKSQCTSIEEKVAAKFATDCPQSFLSLVGFYLAKNCANRDISKNLDWFQFWYRCSKIKSFSFGKIGQKPTSKYKNCYPHNNHSLISHTTYRMEKPFHHQSICFNFWPAITYLPRGISKNPIWYILKKRVFW